ncbi:MAG: leucine-rich repeat protein [Muribaculaceae bacterium]|nr:leucine-rich repeat protein [Muribaculaceae bacterium]
MVGGLAYNKNSDGKTVTVTFTKLKFSTNYEGLTGKLTIPQSVTYGGTTYTVNAIGDNAFYLCRGLTGTLELPSTITSIGENAFYLCRGFSGSLVIPNSVKTIGAAAFSDCSGLNATLTIGESVTSIGEGAFSGCSEIKSVVLNAENCTGPVNSEGVWFKDCQLQEIVIGNSVKSIPSYLAYQQSKISSLTIPNSVTTVGYYAFYGCSGLTGSLVIPNSVTSIEKSAFYGCSGFKGSLIIPYSVTNIGATAFYGCSGFDKSLLLASSVSTIGSSAFEGCSGFTGSLVIPESVTNIHSSTFAGCSGFTGSLVLPASVTNISDNAFDRCSGFTGTLELPNTVTSMGFAVFRGCSGFTGTLTIPASVNSIGGSAFERCAGLTGIVVEQGNKTYDSRNKCNAIIQTSTNLLVQGCKNTVIPNSVNAIGNYAFSGCTGLKSINIPNSLSTVGSFVFTGCSDLESVVSLNNSPAQASPNSFDGISARLIVSNGCARVYRNTTGWDHFATIDEIVFMADDVNGYGSDTITVPVVMKNGSLDVTGFQCDLKLDNHFSVVTDADGYYDIMLSERATRKHTLDMERQADGSLRLLCYSTDSRAFSGEDGALFYVKVRVSDNVPAGDYALGINNIELATTSGASILCPDQSSTISVKEARPGDSNLDRRVSVGDVITTSAYILGRNPNPFCFSGADVNSDGNVSVADVVLTSNIILEKYNPEANGPVRAARVMSNDAMQCTVIETRPDGTHTVAIALDNTTSYTAFQADLTLPEGVEVLDARLSDRAGRYHRLGMNQVDGNTVRLLAYASDNSEFAGNSGNLLYIDVKGAGEIGLGDILMCEADGCEHEVDEVVFGIDVNGINDITVVNGGPVNVYNTAGQLIRRNVTPATATQGLPAGLYLVGNKKVAVK